MRRGWWSGVVWAIAASVCLAAAAPAALGPGEFQVNTTTAGDQASPSVAMDAAGNFVVVWANYQRLASGAGWRLLGQRFGSSGEKLGGEFGINTYYGVAAHSSVAMDAPSGNFVVVWSGPDSNVQDANNTVRGQRFDRSGNRLGGEFVISADGGGYAEVVIAPSSQNLVVAWEGPLRSTGQSGYEGYENDILAQRLDATGTRVGRAFKVSSSTFRAKVPAIASSSQGDSLVAWQVGYGGTQGAGVLARGFDRNGDLLGPELGLSGRRRLSYDDDLVPSVGAGSDGTFVVAWSHNFGGNGPYHYGQELAQRVDRSSSPLGAVTALTGADGEPYSPKIAADAAGGFIVAWETPSIVGRRLTGAGSPLGPEFPISTFRPAYILALAVASSDTGKAVAVWQSRDQDGSGDGIFGRVLDLDRVGIPCAPSLGALCLDAAPGDRRFRVEASYSTSQAGGLAGQALAVPLASVGFTAAGLFAFADPKTPDLMVKLLPACGFTNHWWFFISGSTNMAFTLKLTDTLLGEPKVYDHPDLTPVETILDFEALPCF